jgi:transcriptional regulator GlxA family with amidase domain
MTAGARARVSPRDIASPPYRIGFLLVHDFPMMAFAAAIEPLRAANRLTARKRLRLAAILTRRCPGPRQQRHRHRRARRA